MRILEVIKTGDTEKAASNLTFLLRAGLLSDPNLTEKLGAFLKTRAAGDGPALPAADSRVAFEKTDALTSTIQGALQSLLDRYAAYLGKAGFPDLKKVLVQIKNLDDVNAYYEKGTIVIDPRLADDPAVPLREYGHHALTSERFAWEGPRAGIESGIADYLACSFLGNPRLGEKAAKAFGLKTPYIRILSNDRSYGDLRALAREQLPYAGAEIWGGAFWEMRQKLGQGAVDQIVISAWQKTKFPDKESAIDAAFVKQLRTEANELDAAQTQVLDAILRSRGFP